MDDSEKARRIAELREQLKDGRGNQADPAAGPNGPGDDLQAGTAFQDAGRAIDGAASNRRSSAGNERQPGGDERGSTTVAVGRRPADRRRSSDSGSPATSTTAAATGPGTRRVGSIIADEPIPIRSENPITFDRQEPTFKDPTENPVQLNSTQLQLSSKYPRLRSIFEQNSDITIEQLARELKVSNGTAHKVKKQWFENRPETAKPRAKEISENIGSFFKGGSILSKREAEERAESFVSALENDFQALDQYLWYRQKTVGIETNNQPIWSDLDSEEIEKISGIMLRWGQRNAAAAAAVRGVSESGDYIAVASIFVPRVRNTVDIVRKTRKPRPKRGQRANSN